MRNPSPTDVDVAIVGAGPFGLSTATYLKDKGAKVAILGDPMSFWRDHMPAGMYLRSNWAASHISDPHGKLTLDHYKADAGVEFKQPVPLQNFVEYGQWYQQKSLPELIKCQVTGVGQVARRIPGNSRRRLSPEIEARNHRHGHRAISLDAQSVRRPPAVSCDPFFRSLQFEPLQWPATRCHWQRTKCA